MMRKIIKNQSKSIHISLFVILVTQNTLLFFSLTIHIFYTHISNLIFCLILRLNIFLLSSPSKFTQIIGTTTNHHRSTVRQQNPRSTQTQPAPWHDTTTIYNKNQTQPHQKHPNQITRSTRNKFYFHKIQQHP